MKSRLNVLIAAGIAAVTTFSLMHFTTPDDPEIPSNYKSMQHPEINIDNPANNKDLQNFQGQDLVTLVQTQAELIDTLQAMTIQITALENRLSKMETVASQGPEVFNDALQEDPIASYEENPRQDFINAQNIFLNQRFDPSWDVQMRNSFEEVEATLQSVFADSITITEQECRSDTCRVEFTHEQLETSLHPLMIAARGSNQMHFDTVVENGQKRTIVIYQR